jgi:hypothetical protein
MGVRLTRAMWNAHAQPGTGLRPGVARDLLLIEGVGQRFERLAQLRRQLGPLADGYMYVCLARLRLQQPARLLRSRRLVRHVASFPPSIGARPTA